MRKIKLITDSTCDLTDELLAKHNIDVLPLSVNFSDESFLDRIDINPEELYNKVSNTGELPKTAAVTIPQFEEIFTKYYNEGYDIIYMGISKTMSRTYENAIIASIEISEEHIFILDSMNLSTGISLLLLKASKYINEGLETKDIYAKLQEDNKKVLSQFVIDTMKYLHMGGRCSGIAAVLGTALSIKPIIAVRNGKMHVQRKPIGMKKGLQLMLEQLKKDKDNLDPDHIFVTHSLNFEACDYLTKEIRKEFPNIDIITTTAGCVISSHCGRGTIGILYMVKEAQ